MAEEPRQGLEDSGDEESKNLSAEKTPKKKKKRKSKLSECEL